MYLYFLRYVYIIKIANQHFLLLPKSPKQSINFIKLHLNKANYWLQGDRILMIL
jgi:hypothetical protein